MSIFVHEIQKLPRPVVGFGTLLLERLDHFGSSSRLIDARTGADVTYGEMALRVRCLSSSLISRGFGKGDTLMCLAPNQPDYLTVLGGIACAHLTLTTANPAYTPSELTHQIVDSECCAIFTTQELLPKVQEALESIPHHRIRNVFLLEYDENHNTVSRVPGVDITPFSDLLSHNGYVEPATDIDPLSDVFLLPYSSGTTGKPKGVMLTHSNMVCNTFQYAAFPHMIGADSNSTFLAMLPMFHIYGLFIFLMCAPYVGADIVVMPGFDPDLVLSSIERYRVSTFYMAPPVALFLAKHPAVDKFDTSSLLDIKCGAAPLKQELQEQLCSRLDPSGSRLVVRQGWGMTELSPLAIITPHCDAYSAGFGTVGRVLPATHGKIIPLGGHPNQDPVAIGEEGELLIRGPQVMKGYFNNQSATSQTLSECGWLRTGDVATVDSRGFFHITDRVKELIKTKGFQVAPAELEGVLLSHPSVEDCCVFGVPDERAGELPIAAVVLKPGHSLDERGVKSFMERLVAPYKQLTAVKFVQDIPKTASGKILRRILRNRML